MRSLATTVLRIPVQLMYLIAPQPARGLAISAAGMVENGVVATPPAPVNPHDSELPARWKHDGVSVVPADQLDANTAQTPGMDRKAAINFARVGAQKLWAGTVTSTPTPRPAPTTTARWKA